MVRPNLRLREHGSPTRRELIAYRTFGICMRERILSIPAGPAGFAAPSRPACRIPERLLVGVAGRRLCDASFAGERFDRLWTYRPYLDRAIHRQMDGAGLRGAGDQPNRLHLFANLFSEPSESRLHARGLVDSGSQLRCHDRDRTGIGPNPSKAPDAFAKPRHLGDRLVRRLRRGGGGQVGDLEMLVEVGNCASGHDALGCMAQERPTAPPAERLGAQATLGGRWDRSASLSRCSEPARALHKRCHS